MSQLTWRRYLNASRTIVETVKSASKNVETEAEAKARTGGNLRSPEELHQAIAVLAYQRAESRNFEPGHEMEDRLTAEGEVLVEKKGLKGFPA
jgi:hypothetical protein